MFDFETSVTGIEFKVRQLADEVARLRTLVSEKEDECQELKEALNDKEILINIHNDKHKKTKLSILEYRGNRKLMFPIVGKRLPAPPSLRLAMTSSTWKESLQLAITKAMKPTIIVPAATIPPINVSPR